MSHALMSGGFEWIFVALMGFAVVIVPFWKIFSKAGFPGALALLMLVPVINVITLFVIAFAEWPALKPRRAE